MKERRRRERKPKGGWRAENEWVKRNKKERGRKRRRRRWRSWGEECDRDLVRNTFVLRRVVLDRKPNQDNGCQTGSQKRDQELDVEAELLFFKVESKDTKQQWVGVSDMGEGFSGSHNVRPCVTLINKGGEKDEVVLPTSTSREMWLRVHTCWYQRREQRDLQLRL